MKSSDTNFVETYSNRVPRIKLC